MRLLKTMRKDDAVYWAPVGIDDSSNPTWAAPIDLKVRWEDSDQVIQTAKGEQVTSSAMVFVGQDVKLGGVLWQGTVAALTDSANPFNNEGAGEILKFDKVPTFKGDDFERVAYL
jgi:hypothetical protein